MPCLRFNVYVSVTRLRLTPPEKPVRSMEAARLFPALRRVFLQTLGNEDLSYGCFVPERKKPLFRLHTSVVQPQRLMSESAPPALPDDLPFEHALQRLETLVAQLEGDSTSLEEALKAYEEGVLLARYCLERLDTAELRIQELALE